MSSRLTISAGQFTDRGHKEINQDFHGIVVPEEPLLTTKGIAAAIADGISSSRVSQIASEAAVRGFLDDYLCTSESWSVQTSAQRVLYAINSWLHAQTQKSHDPYDKDRGYVCAFSAVVFKSTSAYLFHMGDARIYRLRNGELEQLTQDHRLWVSSEKSYLSRGLGITPQLEIDFDTIPLEEGDVFLLVTDGIYEHVGTQFIIDTIGEHADDLDAAAQALAREAYAGDSRDNLTAQLIRIDQLPEHGATDLYHDLADLPLPPPLEPRMEIDGYRIVRSIHDSSRSHVYQAIDTETGRSVVIKTPAVDKHDDPEYIERFLMEEWIARRINNAHVLKPCDKTRKRSHVYVAMEYIEGQTLTQWMIDNPQPDIEAVRRIVEQIAQGLRGFHRQEMIHQDLRPDNIMIDTSGVVKIIDFGATKVPGVLEISSPFERNTLLGTAQYSAPEYFLGESGSTRSDIFSLGVITYQMLSGKLPYGVNVVKCRTRAAQRKLRYRSVLNEEREIPAWIDGVLQKAVHIDPLKRYGELSEFTYDLRHPNKAFLNKTRPPLMERNPVAFWQGVSLILAILLLVQLAR